MTTSNLLSTEMLAVKCWTVKKMKFHTLTLLLSQINNTQVSDQTQTGWIYGFAQIQTQKIMQMKAKTRKVSILILAQSLLMLSIAVESEIIIRVNSDSVLELNVINTT